MRAVLLFAALALLAGCGTKPAPLPDSVPFSGTVTLPSGKPASDVAVLFLPASASQTSGRYKVNNKGEIVPPSAGGKLTLTPGDYTVRFEMLDPNGKAEEARYKAALDAIPTKYKDPQGEGYKAAIAPDTKLDIKLAN